MQPSVSLASRRHRVRLPVALPVDWHLMGSAVHHRTSTEDFSSSGTSVTVLGSPPVGSPVVCSIITPVGWIKLMARVVWADSSRMGLAFDPTG